MSSHPLVTIVIPVYNVGDYLRPAVDSILKQTYRNFELFVIDDGSSDGAIESLFAIEDTRLQITRQSNVGKPATLNRAIDRMRGDYFMVQDADDLSYPTRIEEMVSCMEKYPELGMLFTGYDLIINEKHVAPTDSSLSMLECQNLIRAFKMPGHDPTTMTRAEVFEKIKYNPDLKIAEGLDFILRVGEQYPMMRLGRCLYSYRILSSSITRKDIVRRKKMVNDVLHNAYCRRALPLPQSLAIESDEQIFSTLRPYDYDNNIAAQFMQSVIDAKKNKKQLSALMTGMQCVMLNPTSFHYYKALIYVFLPLFCVDKIRAR